jgi:hypothetical protein
VEEVAAVIDDIGEHIDALEMVERQKVVADEVFVECGSDQESGQGSPAGEVWVVIGTGPRVRGGAGGGDVNPVKRFLMVFEQIMKKGFLFVGPVLHMDRGTVALKRHNLGVGDGGEIGGFDKSGEGVLIIQCVERRMFEADALGAEVGEGLVEAVGGFVAPDKTEGEEEDEGENEVEKERANETAEEKTVAATHGWGPSAR